MRFANEPPKTAVFVTPYQSDHTEQYLDAMLSLPGILVCLATQVALSDFAPRIRRGLAGYCRVADVTSARQLVAALRIFSKRFGEVHRLFGDSEEVQLPTAEARKRLGIPGTSVFIARRFREKPLMKRLFTAAHLPCARFKVAESLKSAGRFAQSVGYPIVVKPTAGARSSLTYCVKDQAGLADAIRKIRKHERQVLLEKFVTGREYSCETFSVNGTSRWFSFASYHPTPLVAQSDQSIPFSVILPREMEDPRWRDIRCVAEKALSTLGIQTGLTHMEWFRRSDGTIVLSEVAARPPGAQILRLLSYAHGVDFTQLWIRLMTLEDFVPPPPRRFASGVVFLRGRQGRGYVRRVRGFRRVMEDFRSMIVAVERPQVGQAAATDYDGDGYVIVRHKRTDRVERALQEIGSRIEIQYDR